MDKYNIYFKYKFNCIKTSKNKKRYCFRCSVNKLDVMFNF